MRRLFSTFAHGAPGAGLLLMRLVAGGTLLVRAVIVLATGPALATAVSHVIVAAIGVLLLVGLWTPIAAALAAVVAAWQAYTDPSDAGYYVLLGALAAALALLGPGIWSIDARLFGWKRVEIRSRKKGTGGAPPV